MIPIVIGGLVYTEAEKVVQRYTAEANLAILQQTRDIMDNRLSEIGKMVMQLALDARVKSVATAEGRLSPEQNFTVWQIYRDLIAYRLTKPELLTFFIYLKKSDTIISPDSCCDSALYYQAHLRFTGMGHSEWLEMLRENNYYNGHFWPSRKVFYGGNNYEAIPFIQSIPLEDRNLQHGLIVVLLDADYIKGLIGELENDEHGGVAIIDQENQLITSFGTMPPFEPAALLKIGSNKAFTEIKDGKKKLIAVETTSRYNSWRYLALMPAEVVLRRVKYIRNITWAATLIILLLGAVVSYYLSYRNYKPLKDLARSIAGLFDGSIKNEGSEYEVLHRGISRIKEAVERQKPLIGALTIGRILNGEYHKKEDLLAALEHTGLELSGRHFAVAVVTLLDKRQSREIDLIGATIESVLHQQRIQLHYLGGSQIAVVFCLDSAEIEDCRRVLQDNVERIYGELRQKYGISSPIALGNLCDDLLEIAGSFNEARQTAEHQLLKSEEGILWYSQLPPESVRYFYPLALEERLIYLVRLGDGEEIGHILDQVYQENFVGRTLSTPVIQGLLFEMRGTIGKIVDEQGRGEMKDLEDRLKINPTNVEQFFAQIRQTYAALCANVSAGRRDKRDMFKEIKDYIAANYTDEGLCLKKIAHHFNLSPTHLSEVFKEEFGVCFSNYLETLRMRQACELLAEREMPVGEVAARLGYNSDKAFRRAFKRVMGISPTDYRGGFTGSA